MGITEDILLRCQQVLEESAALLEGVHKLTLDEINVKRKASNIASEAAFLLLKKAFITPFDREDIWSFRQACESIKEAAQEVAFAKKNFLEGANACRALALATEQLLHSSDIAAPFLFKIERQFKTTPPSPVFHDLLHCGQHAVFCLEHLLIKNS